MTAQVATQDASQPLVYCRWDFCSQAFTAYNDWEIHFEVEHMPHEKAQDFSGKMRRRRRDGQWELVEQRLSGTAENLPLSGATGDTSLTMSLPPFSQNIPNDTQGHMDPRMIFPPQRSPDLYDHDQLVGPEDEYLNLDAAIPRQLSVSLPEAGTGLSQQSEGQHPHSSEASPPEAALHTSQPQSTNQLFWDQDSLTKPYSPKSSPSVSLPTPAQRRFMGHNQDILVPYSENRTTPGGARQTSSGTFGGQSSSSHLSPEKKTPSSSLESKSNSDSPRTIQWGGAATTAGGKKDTPRAQEQGMDRGGIGFGFANK
ncbi:hypothetical protein L202_03463 [Cryptococcus amylolentus CBS 6039]|uniref:Uncharacterized protein n=2 Tax=Cryptococcus amylolentus TaxID=104669 RepID=A0A1E3HT02_9TREE|nr:hypothetical protein L202_03463 [Cryptococcus amylolentus CBS 6039]ODN79493.1 hypothetical protein L202_03463 [Cryptococcus amylolentus CBS 6039]ODO07844.1 hypothetical protein I350_03423 [Cryptococcus amylolentus CBS 6273]